jgi:hypothetical protein
LEEQETQHNSSVTILTSERDTLKTKLDRLRQPGANASTQASVDMKSISSQTSADADKEQLVAGLGEAQAQLLRL